MSEQTAEMTMIERIAAMKQWATDQIGKHTGPIELGPGVIILDPDHFLQKQIATMDNYKPRDLMHTSSYMHMLAFKRYLESKN